MSIPSIPKSSGKYTHISMSPDDPVKSVLSTSAIMFLPCVSKG